MKNISLDFENCFGIGRLKYDFDFSKRNSILVYAPNGVMKTSFSRIFDCLAKNKQNEIKDRIFTNKVTKCSISVDGAEIKSEQIFVAEAEKDNGDVTTQITRLLASKELKDRYDLIYKDLNDAKNEYIKDLKEKSQSTDCEQEVINTFKKNDKDDLLSCLLMIEEDIKKEYPEFTFRYNDIFDKNNKVSTFLGKNKGVLDDYFNRYNTLLSKSSFFHHTTGTSFGTFQANSLLKTVDDGAFFGAKHKIILRDNTEVCSSEQLQEVVDSELKAIISDEKLQEKFQKITKSLDANIDLRAFKVVIENDPTLMPFLQNYESFKKEVWLSFLHNLQAESIRLIELYKAKKIEIETILKEAKKESSVWRSIIDMFNERFDVPFVVKLVNQDDIILKQESAAIQFEYSNSSESVSQTKDQLINILSRGEKRAFYILQLLFEIEVMKKKESECLIIFDDIADSFDYKNKYAIVEYLNELNQGSIFKSIILTHNFDFYRTVGSRLDLSSMSFMAFKTIAVR
jgi:hypothetical protein